MDFLNPVLISILLWQSPMGQNPSWEEQTLAANQNFKNYVNWDQLRRLDQRNRSQVVAVIGSGIDRDQLNPYIPKNHEEASQDGLDTDGNACVDDIFGCDFSKSPPSGISMLVKNDHDTDVASLVLLLADFNRNQKYPIQILPIKIEKDPIYYQSSKTWQPQYTENHTLNLVHAIYYAIRSGADVINLSFGIKTEFINPNHLEKLKEALNFARSKNVVVVAAASNDPNRNHVLEEQAPANLENVISIANNDMNHNLISGYGQNIDLSFIGTGLYGWTENNGLHLITRGSSNATPLVASAIALYRAKYPDVSYEQMERDLYHAVIKDSKLNRIGSKGVFSPVRFLQ